MNSWPEDATDKPTSTMSLGIARDIRAAILRGDLAPGQRIRQEELAEQYGTSRIPVREALRILENDGLVIFIANSGAWIANLNMDECVEVYKIRERLEPLALIESIPHMGAEVRARLSDLATRIEQAADVETFLRLDREFHLLSYSCTPMASLLRMIERFWNTTQHFRRRYSDLIGSEGHWIIHAEHRLLMNAIVEGDTQEAATLLEAHIRRTRKRLEERFSKAEG